jgi:hypothetical protein
MKAQRTLALALTIIMTCEVSLAIGGQTRRQDRQAKSVCTGTLGTADATASTCVPFERISTRNTILVKTEVNGRPATFILDTGSSYTLVESQLLRLSARASGNIGALPSGLGISGEGTWVTATIRIGMKTWRDQAVTASLDAISRSYGQHIDGILGEDVLSSLKSVLIDNTASQIVLTW